MSNNLELKKATVAQIKEKLTTAQSVVLVDYRGLNVAEVTELRKQFRAAGVEYAVLKNSLVGIAAKEVGIEGLDSILEGPTALAFGMTDAVAPAKIIAEFAKKNDKLKVKAGILDGAILDVAGVEKLSAIAVQRGPHRQGHGQHDVCRVQVRLRPGGHPQAEGRRRGVTIPRVA